MTQADVCRKLHNRAEHRHCNGAAGPLTAVMQAEPSVPVRLAAVEAALATRSGLVRYRLATGGGLALILEQWLLWAQRWVQGARRTQLVHSAQRRQAHMLASLVSALSWCKASGSI